MLTVLPCPSLPIFALYHIFAGGEIYRGKGGEEVYLRAGENHQLRREVIYFVFI